MSTNPQVAKENAQAEGEGKTFVLPEDLTDAKFYTLIRFVRYKRDNSRKASARLTPTGSISLPIPSNLMDNYGMDYDTEDTSIIALMGTVGDLATGKNAGDIAGAGFADRVKGAIGTAKSEAGQAWNASEGMTEGAVSVVRSVHNNLTNKENAAFLIAALSKGKGDDNAMLRTIQNQTGMIKNPHITSVFRGVKLREFKYTWIFAPRSASEANKINEMIKFIRGRMHPDYTVGTNQLVLDYPDQCYITFPNNKFLESVNKCFITNVSIDRGNGGNPNFFEDGSPIVWIVSMDFQEAEINVRSDFNSTGEN